MSSACHMCLLAFTDYRWYRENDSDVRGQHCQLAGDVSADLGQEW